MRIVSQHYCGAGQVIVSTQKLLSVQTLERLIIDSSNGVAVGEHRVAVAVNVSTQHRGVTKAACTQEQSATGNFRIFFLTAEPVQQRHDAYGSLLLGDDAGSFEALVLKPA